MAKHRTKPKYFQYARKMIFLGIVFVPLIPYLLALAIAYFFFINSLTQSSRDAMQQVVQHQARLIDRYLNERGSDLAFILQTFSEEELSNPDTLKRLFDHLRKETGAFVDLGVIDATGKHIAYHGPHQLLDKNYAQAEWFLATRAAGQYVSDVFLGFRGEPHFVIARAGMGDNQLILRATIDSDVFTRVVESVRVSETGEAFLLNGQGRYQTRHEGKWDLLDTNPDAKSYLVPVYGVQTFMHNAINGKRYLAAIAGINSGRWILVAQQESSDAFRVIHTAGIYVMVVSLIGGIITVSLAFFSSNRIGNALMVAEEEKEHLRDRLYRSVRLAELGEMTAGFAHEINNPLQIMKSELTLLDLVLKEAQQKALPLSGELKVEVDDSCRQVMVQVDRCSEITGAILRFGRQESPTETRIDLEKLLGEIGAMVEKKALALGIEFHRVILPGTPVILGDTGKLQQVFLNLLNNAIDAIVERCGNMGGRMDFIAQPGSQGWALVTVRDNGTGIPKEVLANIYTPFFTTKPPNKGTGLGLAVCYGLVESMGGAIEVSSRAGEGTQFSVKLPAA